MNLTDAKIRALRPDPKRDRWISDGRGLYVRMRAAGSKVFVVRRKRRGRTRVRTLGPWADPSLTAPAVPNGITLREARQRALETAPARQPDTGSKTVATVAQEYMDAEVHPHHKNPQQFVSYVRRGLLPGLGKRLIRDVATVELANAIKRYAVEHGGCAAGKLRTAIRQIFSYAAESGYTDHDPAATITRRVTGYRYVPRSRVLNESEIRQVWHSDGKHTPLLRWCLVTACRVGEAQSALWADLEQTDAGLIWTKPTTKTGTAHWCLIPPIGVEILDGMSHDHAWIFAPRVSKAPQGFVAKIRHGMEHWNIHDLRRTVATQMRELGIKRAVVEMVLNHRLGGVAGIYDRSELRKLRIESALRWGERLRDIVK